jgi:hypothetical protein
MELRDNHGGGALARELLYQVLPLWRGHGILVSFHGLKPLAPMT